MKCSVCRSVVPPFDLMWRTMEPIYYVGGCVELHQKRGLYQSDQQEEMGFIVLPGTVSQLPYQVVGLDWTTSDW